jgi:hypothetical protein
VSESSALVPQFRELLIDGGGTRLDELAQAVEELLAPPWDRDRKTEDSELLKQGEYRVFRRDETKDAPALRVFLVPSGVKDQAYVSNIVPTKLSELTMDQYNDALTAFCDGFCRPAAAKLGLDCQITEAFFDLSKYLDEDTYRSLIAFSRLANKSTGASHPLDRDRWFGFIVRLHQSNIQLDRDVLEKWLILEGWSEDIAYRLTEQYGYALEVLQYVQSH